MTVCKIIACTMGAIKGGSPENIAYVTKALPQRIVRIDVVGQSMHFELMKSRP